MPAITLQDVANFRAQHAHLRATLPAGGSTSMQDVWRPLVQRLRDNRVPLPVKREFIAKLARGGRWWRFAGDFLPRSTPRVPNYNLTNQLAPVALATGLRSTTGFFASDSIYGMSWLYLPGDDLTDVQLQQHQLFPTLLHAITKYGDLADLCAKFITDTQRYL